MGLIQNFFKEKCPRKLIDGKLHIRQFFAVRTPELIEPPDVEKLIQTFQSPGIQQHAHSGYGYLLKGIKRYLASPEASFLYSTPINDEERGWSQERMEREGRTMRKDYDEIIKGVLDNLSLFSPQSQFHGDRTGEADIFRAARKETEGKDVPDPAVVVPRFLDHELTKNAENAILDAAESHRVVSDSELNEWAEFLILRVMCLMGNRSDCLRNMTWGDFWKAIRKSFAAYPFNKIPSNLNTEGDGGKGDYQRSDPWSSDPNDPDDMFSNHDDDPVWQGVRGHVVEIRFHKTGASYMGYIFLNSIDVMFLKCWEEILSNKLWQKFDERKLENEDAIFIGSSGNPVLTVHRPPRLEMFILRAGIPNSTSYVFRYMYVKSLYNAKSALLREAEQFALCHGSKTAVRSYMGQEHKKLLAVTAHTFYRSQIQKEVEAVNVKDTLTAFSEKQRERAQASMREVDREDLDLALTVEKRKDDAFKSYFRTHKGKEQLILLGDHQRVALLEMLLEGQKQGVTSQGRSPLFLLTGEPIQNLACGVLLLRTFHSIAPSTPCIAVLQESILNFCLMLEDEEHLDLRSVEVKWVERVLKAIWNIRKRKNPPSNLRVLNVFFDISRYSGNGYLYCCGNNLLRNAMVWWHTILNSKQTARGAVVEVVQPSVLLEEFRNQVDQLAKDALVKSKDKNIPKTDADSEGEGELLLVQNVEIPSESDVTLTKTSGTSFRVEVRKTPVKRKDVKWNDDIRLRLLDHYLKYAPDPLLSNRGRKGLMKAIEEQVVAFRDVQVEEGQPELWKHMGKDSMRTEVIQRYGFVSQLKGQKNKSPATGLLRVAEDFLQGEEQSLPEASKLPEFVKTVREEIVAYARRKFMA